MLDQHSQLIGFHRDGPITASCHSLVDIQFMMGQSVYERFPIIQSIQPLLEELKEDGAPVKVPAVEFNLAGRKGYFDFEFMQFPDHPDHIAWLLIDNSRIYRYFQRIQQERNMYLMKEEYKKNGRDVSIKSALD